MCQLKKCFRDRHHLKPQCLGDNDGITLRLWRCRHNAWHRLFTTLTLAQILDLLKVRSTNCGWLIQGRTRHFYHCVGDCEWRALFGNKSLTEAITLLERVQRIKYASAA